MSYVSLIPSLSTVVGAACLAKVYTLTCDGTTSTLGRDILDRQEAEVSGQQLRVTFDKLRGVLSVVNIGKNPSFYVSSQQQHDSNNTNSIYNISTAPDAPTLLRDGDLLTLAGDHGLCRVSMMADKATTLPFPPIAPDGPPAPTGGPPDLNGLQRAVDKVASGAPHPLKFYVDDKCVVLYDQYPKSKVHFLVLPRDTRLHNLQSLRAPQHLGLLTHMYNVGCSLMEHCRQDPAHRRRRMICGFHAIPSLKPLHMHVLSLDLDSPRLKNKKHYNTFTTEFFLMADAVVLDLQQNGRVTLADDRAKFEALEKQPMKCCWCGLALGSMPEVKSHIPSCPSNQSMIME
eukprot:PhM_4_TR18661/c2_g1_i1/m.19896/K10863/APTX; aprataxin